MDGTGRQKTKHVEIVISEQLLGGMTAAAMLHAKSKGKTPAFPHIQQMTDEYRNGMKRAFPEITDGETEKTYKNAYKISAMSMSKSVPMQQSQSRGIDSY